MEQGEGALHRRQSVLHSRGRGRVRRARGRVRHGTPLPCTPLCNRRAAARSQIEEEMETKEEINLGRRSKLQGKARSRCSVLSPECPALQGCGLGTLLPTWYRIAVPPTPLVGPSPDRQFGVWTLFHERQHTSQRNPNVMVVCFSSAGLKSL
jgi:hypothetical protein